MSNLDYVVEVPSANAEIEFDKWLFNGGANVKFEWVEVYLNFCICAEIWKYMFQCLIEIDKDELEDLEEAHAKGEDCELSILVKKKKLEALTYFKALEVLEKKGDIVESNDFDHPMVKELFGERA